MQKIIIFHAGSIGRTLRQIADAFEQLYPHTSVILEGSGARQAVRKVIDQRQACDIVVSADYTIIDDLMKPEFANFNIHIARNRLVISYTDKSKYAEEITTDNWFKILLTPGVCYGHTNPELDPAGYRARFCWQLAERYYRVRGLNAALVAGTSPANILTDAAIIRSRLTTGELDYFFGYQSTARQNGYQFIELPDAINFSSDTFASYYQQAELYLTGKTAGTQMKVTGNPIVYGITLVNSSPNREGAIEFLEFLLDKGRDYLQDSGLTPVVPPEIAPDDCSHVPSCLHRYLRKTSDNQ